MSKIAKIYLSLLGNDEFQIFCENSLEVPEKWGSDTKKKIELGTFDVILTNQPFGAKITSQRERTTKSISTCHKWENGNLNGYRTIIY